MGFRRMEAASLKPKHVEALVERWKAESLSAGTIKSRMTDYAGGREDRTGALNSLVGGARFELATNGLKVRCSTD